LKIEVAFVAASLLASLALAEAALRYFPAFEPQPQAYVGRETTLPHEFLVPDEGIGWRMAPDREFVHETKEYRVVYRSNSDGYREERRTPPSPHDRTIAIVGDSFTFGWGVSYEDSFGARLEAALPATVVHNYALPGYGIDQMWIAERTLALPSRPELVIVAFISEDFGRSLTAHRYNMHLNKPAFVLDGGVLRAKTPADRPPEWLWFLANRSRFWAGAREFMRLVGHRYPVGEWWHLNRALLDTIREDCRKAGTRVLFVYLTTREPRPFPVLDDYMQATAADFMDLDVRAPAPRKLNYPGDAHLNPDGHRYTADAILEWIRREMPALAAAPPDAAAHAAGS